MHASPEAVTQSLLDWRGGNKEALDQLAPLVDRVAAAEWYRRAMEQWGKLEATERG